MQVTKKQNCRQTINFFFKISFWAKQRKPSNEFLVINIAVSKRTEGSIYNIYEAYQIKL